VATIPKTLIGEGPQNLYTRPGGPYLSSFFPRRSTRGKQNTAFFSQPIHPVSRLARPPNASPYPIYGPGFRPGSIALKSLPEAGALFFFFSFPLSSDANRVTYRVAESPWACSFPSWWTILPGTSRSTGNGMVFEPTFIFELSTSPPIIPPPRPNFPSPTFAPDKRFPHSHPAHPAAERGVPLP